MNSPLLQLSPALSVKIPYGTASRLAFILATLGGVWAGSLRAQSTVGLVDLSYVSIDQTYTANVYDNASQWGTPDLYVAAQTLSVSNLSSSTIDLQSSTLIAFCVEVGQDAPTSSTPYQIFDTGSMALTDSTAIPGTPGLQPAVSPFEASAMIDPMSGIGAYRAT